MRAFALAGILAGAAATALAAQQPVLPAVPQALSLKDAVDLALRYNPSYRQVANDRSMAAWGVRNAYTQLFLPSVSTSLGFGYRGAGSQNFLATSFVQGSPTIGSDYSIGLSWQLSGTTLTQPGLAKAQDFNQVEKRDEG